MEVRFNPTPNTTETCAECGSFSAHPNTVYTVEMDFGRGQSVSIALCVFHLGMFSGDLCKMLHAILDSIAPHSQFRLFIPNVQSKE